MFRLLTHTIYSLTKTKPSQSPPAIFPSQALPSFALNHPQPCFAAPCLNQPPSSQTNITTSIITPPGSSTQDSTQSTANQDIPAQLPLPHQPTITGHFHQTTHQRKPSTLFTDISYNLPNHSHSSCHAFVSQVSVQQAIHTTTFPAPKQPHPSCNDLSHCLSNKLPLRNLAHRHHPTSTTTTHQQSALPHLLPSHLSIYQPIMSNTTTALLRRPKATLCYRSMIPPFTITDPVHEAFHSPFQESPSTFHVDHPNGHTITISLHLPNPFYDREYQTFQYIQLWQELQAATAHHDPPLPDNVLGSLWSQMLGTFQ